MIRIDFTAEDIATTRLAPTLGQTSEAIFAYLSMEHVKGGVFSEWRRSVLRRLGRRATSIEEALGNLQVRPALHWLLERPQHSSNRYSAEYNFFSNSAAVALQEFRGAAISPYWIRMNAYLKAETDRRSRILMNGGVGHLLDTLNSHMRWQLPVLEISNGVSADIKLDGRGIEIIPSVFQIPSGVFLFDTGIPGCPPKLIVSAPPDSLISTWLWCAPADEDEAKPALEPLLGHTRAIVLRTLADPCTTTELAEKVNISAAAASQHATILREAGVSVTRRVRNKAIHSLSPMGWALVQGADPGPAQGFVPQH